MKMLLILLLSISTAHSADPISSSVQDEVLSQKYEGLYLDGEDKDFIEDQMVQEGVTPEDLELTDYSVEE